MDPPGETSSRVAGARPEPAADGEHTLVSDVPAHNAPGDPPAQPAPTGTPGAGSTRKTDAPIASAVESDQTLLGTGLVPTFEPEDYKPTVGSQLRFQTMRDDAYASQMCHQAMQTAYHQIGLYLAFMIGLAQLATSATGFATLTSSSAVLGIVTGVLGLLGALGTIIQRAVEPAVKAQQHLVAAKQYRALASNITNYLRSGKFTNVAVLKLQPKFNDVLGNSPPPCPTGSSTTTTRVAGDARGCLCCK